MELGLIPELEGFGDADSLLKLARMAQVARTNLVTRAQKDLATSSRDYVKGIQPMRFEDDGRVRRVVVDVEGALPFMVEHGKDAWDLRETILKPGTRRLRVSKKGFFYVAVPFFHGGADTAGKGGGTPAGSQYTEDSLRAASNAARGDLDAQAARKLGRAVMRAAGKLAPTLSAPGKGVKYGERLPAGTAGATVLRPRHATDLFAGMIREQKTYEAGTQNQFVTFRIISNDPDTFREDDGGRNWTHPGIAARHLVPATLDYMDGLIQAGVF